MKTIKKHELNLVSGGAAPLGTMVLAQAIGGLSGGVAGNIFGLSSDEGKCYTSQGITIPGAGMGTVTGAFAGFGFYMGSLTLFNSSPSFALALKAGLLGGVSGGLFAAAYKNYVNNVT